jgi:hypothetical protein
MRALCSTLAALFACTFAAPGVAATDSAEPPLLREIAAAVDANELHATIARLVGFGTRHTLSDTRSDTHGIGAARRWVQSRFSAIARDCGQCLDIVTPSQAVTGPRVPQPTEVVNGASLRREPRKLRG